MIGGNVIAAGYSGAPGHVNKTESEELKNLGPIPRGGYAITLIYPTHAQYGPHCCVLTPDPSNKMFDRSGFMVHADSIKERGAASHGCIVLGPRFRQMLRVGDRIQVV